MSQEEAERIANQAFSGWYRLDRIADPALAAFFGDAFWGAQAPGPLDRTLKKLGQPGTAGELMPHGLTESVAAQVNSVDPQEFADEYILQREAYHKMVGERVNPKTGKMDQKQFVQGWDNRWRNRWIQFKLNTDRAGDALLWLQGQSIDKVNWQFGKMTKGEVQQLAAVAASQPGIGPDLKGFLDQWLQGKPLRRSRAL